MKKRIENVALINGQRAAVPDGTWYAVARWDAARRDYVDDPTAGVQTGDAAGIAMSLPVGARLVRYTVAGGYVTTRRGLA